jgi:catechol 2,3-dioxygenase-like lactoylglutathione lyase family enzyme
MRLPNGHAKRLFLGFTCSIMFLVLFALLVAHNTEAESSSPAVSVAKEKALAIAIPTLKPIETIEFYKKLGFRAASDLTGELDVVCMEKPGTSYRLVISHSRSSAAGPLSGGVSGMSFRVNDLSAQITGLEAKGLNLSEISHGQDGIRFASLKDPNGINVKLFER